MTRTLRLLPPLLAVLLALAYAAHCAAASPDAAAAAEPSKNCSTARKKADKEQRSLTSATESIARDKKARESCSSKSMCARYDAAISAMEKRQARHETRLTRFKEDVDNLHSILESPRLAQRSRMAAMHEPGDDQPEQHRVGDAHDERAGQESGPAAAIDHLRRPQPVQQPPDCPARCATAPAESPAPAHRPGTGRRACARRTRRARHSVSAGRDSAARARRMQPSAAARTPASARTSRMVRSARRPGTPVPTFPGG